MVRTQCLRERRLPLPSVWVCGSHISISTPQHTSRCTCLSESRYSGSRTLFFTFLFCPFQYSSLHCFLRGHIFRLLDGFCLHLFERLFLHSQHKHPQHRIQPTPVVLGWQQSLKRHCVKFLGLLQSFSNDESQVILHPSEAAANPKQQAC